MKRILSSADLERIHTHPARRAAAALERGDVRAAELAAIRLSTYHFQLYFGYLHWIARMLGCIYRRHGATMLHLALKESIPVWLDPVLRSFERNDLRAGIEHLVTSWRSEMGGIEVREDARSVVILKKPCGSGGRLLLEGWHGRVPEAYPLVADWIPAEGGIRSPLSPLCAACFVFGELFEERLGYRAFVARMDPRQTGRVCSIEIRKKPCVADSADPTNLDAVRPPALCPSPCTDSIFSETDLRDLGRPLMDRALAAIQSGRLDEAKRLFERFPDEWRVLHDDLVRWSAAILTFVYRRWGVETIEEFLRACYDPVFRTGFDLMEANDDRTNAESLADVLHSHYMHDFECVEETDRIAFRLRVCGSGGVLVREGGYDAPGRLARVAGHHDCTFSIENIPVYCTHCAVTNRYQLENGGPFGFVVKPGNAIRDSGDPKYDPNDGCEFIYFKGLRGESLTARASEVALGVDR